MMPVDITEEECEFLLRVCTRAQLFTNIHSFNNPKCDTFERNLEKIMSLKRKFLEMDFPSENCPLTNTEG